MSVKAHRNGKTSNLKALNSVSILRNSFSDDPKAKVSHEQFLARCQELKDAGKLAESLSNADVEEQFLSADVRQLLADERMNQTEIKVEGGIPAWMYGHFCAAARVNGFDTWEDAMMALISEHVCEWANDSYFLLDNRYLTKPQS